MSEITIWYDPVRFRYCLSRGNVVEEVHPITRQYIEDLTAENVKLREQGTRLFDKTLELSTKNTKLRELVEDMLDCIEIRSAFGRPPTSEMCENFAQRAGELGIEVE